MLKVILAKKEQIVPRLPALTLSHLKCKLNDNNHNFKQEQTGYFLENMPKRNINLVYLYENGKHSLNLRYFLNA